MDCAVKPFQEALPIVWFLGSSKQRIKLSICKIYKNKENVETIEIKNNKHEETVRLCHNCQRF